MPKVEILREGIGENYEVAIYYPEEFTPETPVIFTLHGNWATRARNDNYGRFFAENGFLVVAPTFRHHHLGNHLEPTATKLGKTSTMDYTRDVEQLMWRLRRGLLTNECTPKKPPIIIGHSMGGIVAQVIASQKDVSAVILLSSAPPAGINLHTDKGYKKRIVRFALLIFGGKAYLPDFESLSLYVYNGMPEEDHKKIYAKAVYESGRSSREILAGSGNNIVRFLARILSKPIVVDEKSVTCPILVIGAKNDKSSVPQVAKELYKKYSSRPLVRTDLKIFENFAHWVQYEPGWEESAAYILEWVKEAT